MSDPGPVLAHGRDCEVFALGADRVVRRYREPRCTPREAAVMERARAQGYSVPRVHDVSPTDLVLDRVDGPTMAEDLTRRPWMLRSHAHTLASLHHGLHDIPAPEWLDAPLGDGSVLIHLDLHPLNVIMGRDGPVVIDWTNARRGVGDADVALTWLLLMTGAPDEGGVLRILLALGRRSFARFFLSRFVRKDVMAQLDTAVGFKLHDPNLRDVERTAIHRIIAETRR